MDLDKIQGGIKEENKFRSHVNKLGIKPKNKRKRLIADLPAVH